MIIAFYNPAGGVGATTLAVHTCVLARELGLRVAGVSELQPRRSTANETMRLPEFTHITPTSAWAEL